MKEFSITGSTVLKEAFAKEVGVKLLSIDSAAFYEYLHPSTITEKALSGISEKEETHFNLPEDWNEAVKYAKRFFGLVKPKAGEYIKITKEAKGFKGKLGSYHRVKEVDDDVVQTDADYCINLSKVGYEIVTEEEFIESILKAKYIVSIGASIETAREITEIRINGSFFEWTEAGEKWSFKHNWKIQRVRHATPTEIEELKNHLPTIAGIKGQYTDTGVKYGCQEFTFEEVNFMGRIFYGVLNEETMLVLGGASVRIAEIKQVVEIVKNRAK